MHSHINILYFCLYISYISNVIQAVKNSMGPIIITTAATPIDSPILSSQDEETNCDHNFLQLPTFNSMKMENGLNFKETSNNQYERNLNRNVLDGKNKKVEQTYGNEEEDCK